MRAAVDVQHLAGDLFGLGQVHDRIDDVLDLGNAAQRLQGAQNRAGTAISL
jgi:hypothetical protein